MEDNSTVNLFIQELEDSETETKKQTPPVQHIGDHDRFEELDVINLQNIRQVYKGKRSDFVLFEDLNMDIKDFKHEGQFVSILGQSGCGKSTVLRYISGLQQPTEGKVLIYGKEKTEKEPIPMVFQQYSSLPWKTVLENVALPLLMKGVSKEESYEKAYEMIRTVHLEGHEHKWAKYPLLSGGQLQRVAIARNLIASPQILLMDEPFGALDIATRTSMQQTVLDIYNNATLDPTVVFVTHDISEAVLLSNRIYIMAANPGRVHTILDIDLPEYRDISVKKSEQLNEYVNFIDNLMNELCKE
ncbi:MAG: ABC transporter ATP-binding protein [Tannerellaceae bacterium]|nr:ABC transporter ATP-binding protein [Tannerellaceae bacterium]